MSKSMKAVIIFFGVLGVVFIIGLLKAASDTGNPPPASTMSAKKDASTPKPPAPKPQATFEAKVVSSYDLNPATYRIAVDVKNTSTIDSKVSCTLSARDESGTYSGFDIFEPDEIVKAGQTIPLNGNITITKEGASYVSKVDAKCKPVNH